MPLYNIIKHKKSFVFTLTPLFVLFFISSAIAQPPPVPQGDSAGAQTSRFQADAERERARVERKPVKKPQIDMEPEKAATEAPAGPAFLLKSVNVTGSSIFKPEDLKASYALYIGREVTFKDLETIAAAIKAQYARKGYLTTVVYVPEQDIKEGKVEINISEGKTGEVKIEGNKWFSTDLIRKYIHTKKNEILDIMRLQRDILRLNQGADLEIKAVIAEGKEPATSDIILKATEKFPYHTGLVVDNQGTRLVGKYRDSITFRSSNLTGFNDSLYFSTIMSATSSGNFLTYAFPIDTYGTKAGFICTIFDSRLGQEYKVYDINSQTQMYTPHISGEIYLSDILQVGVDAGLEIKSIKKWGAQGVLTANDQLRLPYFSFDISKMDGFLTGGQTSFSPKFTFGTADFLGASSQGHPSANRAGTGGNFVKYEHNISRYQRMFSDSYMTIRSQFQFASRTLPSSEQLQLGGAYSVRGYPEGDYLADAGATVEFDWYFPCYFVPKDYKLPGATRPLRNQIEPVVFFDMGGGKLTKLNPGEKEAKILMGAGGGLKVSYNTNLFLRLDWAQAIYEAPVQGNGASTFYITLQVEV